MLCVDDESIIDSLGRCALVLPQTKVPRIRDDNPEHQHLDLIFNFNGTNFTYTLIINQCILRFKNSKRISIDSRLTSAHFIILLNDVKTHTLSQVEGY